MCSSLYQLPSVDIDETLSLTPGVVDLWYYFYEEIDDAELLAAHDALMTPDERVRHGRFLFERDRRMFLATRALVRTVLSNYAAVAPADWRFVAGEHGKPRIDSPAVTPRLHFNLANTRGLVVCAVSVAHDTLGVDAERIDRSTDTLKLADRYFCPSEVLAIRSFPAIEQTRSFFAHWTLKESYIKARGQGLAIPLDQFSFRIDDTISICIDQRLADDASRWRFALLDTTTQHMIAVGAETGGFPLSLRARNVVPLRSG
jgi:4'-phosphopantetheinyl transferase